MKTIRHIIFLALASLAVTVQAQNCTPDTTIKVAGFYPNKLADGNVGTPYSQTVMVLSFKDTSVVVGGSKQKVTIDSLKLTKVIGLPTGMGYLCFEPRCIYLPSKVRCIKLNGTPAQSGVFPLKLAIIAYAKVNGFIPVSQPDTIKNFSITITGGTAQITENGVTSIRVYPNPVTNQIFVSGCTSKPQIYNALGAEINLNMMEENGLWSADVSSLNSGIYFMTSSGIHTQWIKE
ncbi:MAG: T9SS type A sorting domain-containing protein [Bacteroidetes bacterium]|nr:T9SS type A sorting domain-containing protein [Bacteroidota bacterium]MDA1224305.1 T9SS type A sorting domain-containing protein [Bacteroidota bacterium]